VLFRSAFFKGSTGAIYRQFSLTIVSAMSLSILVALILTPALCATMLKPIPKGHHEAKTGFFGWFNRTFIAGRTAYRKSVGYVAARVFRFLLIYAAVIGGLFFMFNKIPTSFLPDEDQGIMIVSIMAPPGATLERTRQSVKMVEDYFLNQEKENVQSMFTATGFSFSGRGQNVGLGFVRLKDWSLRKRPDQKVQAIAQRAMQRLYGVQDAFIYAFFPPPIIELGNASGFDFQLLDQGGLGHQALVNARNQMLGMAMQNPKLTGVRPNGMSDVPEFKLDIDHEKAKALGVSVGDINSTLQIAWGSAYVNDFLHEGRIKKVYIQGDAPYRMMPEDINKWYVKNSSGMMVPFSAFSSAHWSYGSPKLERFNGTSSQEIVGAAVQGVSTGEAMQIITDMAKKLPKGIGLEWVGISYEERMAGAQTMLLYSLSLLIVFLCLAALYESWSIPFAVMLIVPLGLVGAVTATLVLKMSNDVYFQVGLLTTIGLASKNAILIVEFAKNLYAKGHGILQSAMRAAELRLRPILMTSMAFILGVSPLALDRKSVV
jgi:HAE1 family hydrophobic/amphiphilic exporter-1/multidrug efflux pump